jgi:hypothetical protein
MQNHQDLHGPASVGQGSFSVGHVNGCGVRPSQPSRYYVLGENPGSAMLPHGSNRLQLREGRELSPNLNRLGNPWRGEQGWIEGSSPDYDHGGGDNAHGVSKWALARLRDKSPRGEENDCFYPQGRQPALEAALAGWLGKSAQSAPQTPLQSSRRRRRNNCEQSDGAGHHRPGYGP